MLLAALALQAVSLLPTPLYLDPEPPELRAVQYMAFPHVGIEGLPPGVELSRDEALAAAEQLLAAIREKGASFQDLGRRIMRGRGIELGSYAAGMLPPAMDAWLFSAELDAISGPLDTPFGVTLLRRVPAWAGARMILLTGEDAPKLALEVTRKLQAGEPFEAVARAYTMDLEARERGGATAIFQRGASDKLLKAACFDMEEGVWRGPMESPLGLHFLQRVAPESIAEVTQYERTCVRVRALFIAHGGDVGRTREAAFELATALAVRIRDGEDLATLAATFDDNPGGRERRGDLGWVFRTDPRRPDWTEQLISRPVGWTTDAPLATDAGYVIARRED